MLSGTVICIFQGVKGSYILSIFSRFCYISYICLKFSIYFLPKSYIFLKLILLWEKKLNILFWVEISYKHDKYKKNVDAIQDINADTSNILADLV